MILVARILAILLLGLVGAICRVVALPLLVIEGFAARMRYTLMARAALDRIIAAGGGELVGGAGAGADSEKP